MCLAIPGQILSIDEETALMRSGRVSFGGTVKTINLAYTPEAQEGDFVIVHAGFAISRLDQHAAQATWDHLNTLERMSIGEDADEIH